MHPTFSVVIPCYNEEKYLGLLLDRLAKQSVQPHQVIIGNSNSTDNTVQVALGYASKLPIQIATTHVRTPGGARNAGAALATADYILFLDADCLPVGCNFLQRLQTQLQTRPIDCASCMFTSDGWHPLSYIFFWGVNALLLTGWGFKGGIPVIGGMTCVRRSWHHRIHGFDESSLLGEDTEYGMRLAKAGATGGTLPWIYVVHSNRRGRQEGHLNALLHSMPLEGSFWGWFHARRIAKGKAKKYGQF